jgi:hypothetical protein
VAAKLHAFEHLERESHKQKLTQIISTLKDSVQTRAQSELGVRSSSPLNASFNATLPSDLWRTRRHKNNAPPLSFGSTRKALKSFPNLKVSSVEGKRSPPRRMNAAAILSLEQELREAMTAAAQLADSETFKTTQLNSNRNGGSDVVGSMVQFKQQKSHRHLPPTDELLRSGSSNAETAADKQQMFVSICPTSSTHHPSYYHQHLPPPSLLLSPVSHLSSKQQQRTTAQTTTTFSSSVTPTHKTHVVGLHPSPSQLLLSMGSNSAATMTTTPFVFGNNNRFISQQYLNTTLIAAVAATSTAAARGLALPLLCTPNRKVVTAVPPSHYSPFD